MPACSFFKGCGERTRRAPLPRTRAHQTPFSFYLVLILTQYTSSPPEDLLIFSDLASVYGTSIMSRIYSESWGHQVEHNNNKAPACPNLYPLGRFGLKKLVLDWPELQVGVWGWWIYRYDLPVGNPWGHWLFIFRASIKPNLIEMPEKYQVNTCLESRSSVQFILGECDNPTN